MMRFIPRGLEHVHVVLFRRHFTDRERTFIDHLTLSVVGTGLANGLLFGVSVLAGRLLGPEQFGRYGLVLAFSQFLMIPMMLGMDTAVVRGVAISQTSLSDVKRLVASGFWTVIGAGFVVCLAFFIGQQQLLKLIPVSRPLLTLGTGLAGIVTVKLFADAVIRGQGKFAVQARVRLIEAAVVLISFLLLCKFAAVSVTAVLVASMIGAATAAIIYSGGYLWPFLSLRFFDFGAAWQLWRYIRFGVLGAVGGLFLAGADKFIISHLIDVKELGVYTAYYLVSVQLMGQIAAVVINVFFPAVAAHARKLALLRRLKYITFIGFLPGLMSIMVVTSLGLLAFSGRYPFNWGLMAGMSLYATLYFIYQVYAWFLSSVGAAGVRAVSLHGLIAGVIYLASVLLAVPRLGLLALPLSFCISFGYLAAAWRFHEGLIVNSELIG